MALDLSKFKNKKKPSNRYDKHIQAVKAQGKQVDCIEAAVKGAIDNIKAKNTRAFVIYGEPQSGKTEMMIGLTARLLDEGHKIIIHLLNDNVSLLEQNLYRFQNSGLSPAPCNYTDVLDSAVEIGDKEWVIFCKKNGSNLRKLIEKIGDIDGKVIIDDEADYASPNAKVNKKDGEKTKINELIEKLLKKKGIYIGVTATPARLDLNYTFENDHEKWIDFPPHKKYNGQDDFFPLDHNRQYSATLIPDGASDIPVYARNALFGFMVNVAYLNLNPHIHNGPKNYSFLIHTSGQTADHKTDYQTIQKTFGTLSNHDHKDFDKYATRVWEIAEKRYGAAVADKILAYILENIPCRNIVVMNSVPEFEKNHKSATSPSTIFTVVIGGNIVSRGMTFDNLLAMYFTRDVKHKIQQDTYIQRARMFGTREYLKYFELTIPESLYLDWHRCFVFHRLSLLAIRNDKHAPVWLGDGRIASTAGSSIAKYTVSMSSGEMGFEIFDYEKIKDSVKAIQDGSANNFDKLKQLQKLLGGDKFPSFFLSFIQTISPNDDEAIKIHDPHSIAGMSDADQTEITREKGFLGGAGFTKNPHIIHHFRILTNAKGRARLIYRYSGSIKFLKNKKVGTPQKKAA